MPKRGGSCSTASTEPSGSERDLRGDIGLGQAQPGHPRRRCVRGDHGFSARSHMTSALFSYEGHLSRAAGKSTRSEVAEPATGIQDRLVARLDQGNLVLRVCVRRDMRRRQHLDAVDLERRRTPIGGHELDQRCGESCRRLECRAGPVVDRSVLAALEVRKAAALPRPSGRADFDAVGRAVQIERAGDRSDTSASCRLQSAVHFQSEQGLQHTLRTERQEQIRAEQREMHTRLQ